MSDDSAAALGRFREIAVRFLGACGTIEPVGTALHLVRVTVAGESYVVRCWPVDVLPEQIRLSQDALALAHPIDPVIPEPVRVLGLPDAYELELGGRWYTATRWLPGTPLARYGDYRTHDGTVVDVPLPVSAPADDVIAEAARAIGRLHTATAGLAVAGGPLTVQRLLAGASREWTDQRRTVGRRSGAFPEIRRWMRCGNRVLPVAAELLAHLGETGGAVVVVHGDLWPANLLVEGRDDERVLSGIAGWSSVASGSPLVDIAHLVTHGSGWSSDRAEAVLGAYTDTAHLSPVERRLLPVVAALTLVPEVGRLLHMAFIDDRMMRHDAQGVLRSGLKSLLTSLESLTNTLAPEAEWDQRKTSAARRERGQRPPRRPRAPRTRSG